jgi:hypothetical protein
MPPLKMLMAWQSPWYGHVTLTCYGCGAAVNPKSFFFHSKESKQGTEVHRPLRVPQFVTGISVVRTTHFQPTILHTMVALLEEGAAGELVDALEPVAEELRGEQGKEGKIQHMSSLQSKHYSDAKRTAIGRGASGLWTRESCVASHR